MGAFGLKRTLEIESAGGSTSSGSGGGDELLPNDMARARATQGKKS